MVTKFHFPKPSANVENATLTAWLKQVGDDVTAGEIVEEITTDKGVIEVEAPVDGRLLAIIAEEGSMLPVGYVMGLIGDPGDTLPDVTEENERILAAFTVRAGGGGRQASERGGRDRQKGPRVRATPAARRLAREHGVDVAEVARKNGAETVDEEMVNAFLNQAG
ncbi:MAG: biotin/lipoyl-containing protein [Lentisphaeria bacterium]|nr:biotin/lipoyl-containing protein [Lentisphaeria bacterium]